MIHVLKHILIGCLSIIMVAATGGFGLIQHYCACDHNAQSIVEQINIPENSADPESCCTTEKESHEETCCKDKPKQRKNAHHSCNSGDCCFIAYSYFKTDQVNLTDASNSDYKFILAYHAILHEGYRNTLAGIHRNIEYSDRLPPPKFGKELLLEIHQLKSDPLLV